MPITFFSPKIRKTIIHLIVLIIAYKFLISTAFRFQASRPLELCNNASYIIFFFIHSLLLLPILIEKKNLKKYLLFTLISYVLFTIAKSWFQAAHSALIIINEDGTYANVLDFFLRKGWIIGGIISLFPSIIAMVFFSFIYYLLIHSIKKFLPYLEVIVNVFILSIIYTFILVRPEMGFSEVFWFCIVLIVFYTHTFLITPILVRDQKKSKYALSLVVLCTCYYFLLKSSIKTARYNIEMVDLFQENKSEEILIGLIILVITLLLSFLYGYVRLKKESKEKSLRQKIGAKDSELQLLKSQVNPHFLFNTLNTLYATALEENAPKTAESTAKIANLLRYMQNDIAKDFIPLENEIKYLEDYITIQKLRCEIEPQIKTEFTNIENHEISPGLLIPFVENAFKYGIDPSKPSTLGVSVVCTKTKINFECINSYNEDFKTYYKEQGFGIGISNAQQRLELVYPKKHTLEIVKEDNVFSVIICIETANRLPPRSSSQ
tara:strand:+ start:1402 stop:2877 length:1476 start_codon:yes stop_codon:yes gene_type:complete